MKLRLKQLFIKLEIRKKVTKRREIQLEFQVSELVEAKRQIESTIHKLKETVKTLEGKENPDRYKSQITLAKRRLEAFSISISLIEREISDLDKK